MPDVGSEELTKQPENPFPESTGKIMNNDILIFSGGWYFTHDKYYMEAMQEVNLTARFIYPQKFDDDVKKQIDESPGIILSGGGDIHPRFFAPEEPPHETLALVNEERDSLELAAVPYIIQKKKPLLAICRGIQVLNCAFSGTLYQDIDALAERTGTPIPHHQIKGRNPSVPRRRASHEVILEQGSLIEKITGKRVIRVNSTHHQSAGRIGDGLWVTGKSPDGIVEVMEIPGNPLVLGVQFHPERMMKTDKTMRKIFEYFAEVVIK